MQTSLPKETEEKLQVALKQGGAEQLAEVQAVAESQPAPTASPTTEGPAETGLPH
jgi:hypothetical protein